MTYGTLKISKRKIFQSLGILVSSLVLFSEVAAASNTTFGEWCDSWQLDCPVGEPANFPLPDRPLSYDQWMAFSNIINAFMDSRSRFSLTRDELEDPNLEKIFQTLEIPEALSNLKEYLDRYNFTSVNKDLLGNLNLKFAETASHQTDAGFDVSFNERSSMAFESSGKIRLKGIGIGRAGSTTDDLTEIKISDINVLDMKTRFFTVNQVPMKFMSDQVIKGIEGLMPSGEVKAKNLMSIAVPLIEWFEDSSRSLNLRKNFFQVVKNEISRLNGTESTNDPNILDILNAAYTGKNSQGNLFTAKLDKEFHCKIKTEGEPDIHLELKKSFGLKSIESRGSDTNRIRVTGIRVKAMGVGFNLNRIDVSPSKVTIRDIPFIGKKEIKLDEQEEGKPSTTTCKYK